MFIGAGALVVIYIYMGIWTLSVCIGARSFSNPLIYGLAIIFWPVFVIAGLCWVINEWIK
jgi:hypothetical protein